MARQAFTPDRTCLERDEQGWACTQVKGHGPDVPHSRRAENAGIVTEPARRGARVVDRNGEEWERRTTLWAHLPRGATTAEREARWLGRWPWYVVLGQHGPLREPEQP